MGSRRVIWWVGNRRWWPLHYGEGCLVLLPDIDAATGDDGLGAGRFLDQTIGQGIRATDTESRLSFVIVKVAGVIIAQHPRLPQSQIGDLKVRIAVLEGRARAQVALGR